MDGERVDVVYGPQLEVPQEGDVASEASVEEPQVEVAAETVGFVSQEPSVAGDAAESTPAAMYARRRQGHALNAKLLAKPKELKLKEIRANAYALELHWQSLEAYCELTGSESILPVLFIESLDRETQALCRDDLSLIARDLREPSRTEQVPMAVQKARLCRVVLHNIGGDPGLSTRKRFDLARQQPEQSFVDWAGSLRRMRQILKLTSDPFAAPISEKELREKVVYASRDPAGLVARLKRDKFVDIPETADLVTVGVALEQEEAARRSEGRVNYVRESQERGGRFKAMDPVRKKDLAGRRCFLCHEPGHMARECPKREERQKV